VSEPTNWWKEKLVTFIAEHTPKCHDMTRLISESRDRPLPLRTRLAMRAHYLICVWCARYRDQLGLLSKAFRACDHGVEHMKGELTPEAKERLKNTLKKNE
jgi:hypothetical protein